LASPDDDGPLWFAKRLKRRIWKGESAPDAQISPPLWHFPLSRKRFMVPLDFAIGKLRYSINIKGLAETLSLWRAV
jgi:hypothetical protein